MNKFIDIARTCQEIARSRHTIVNARVQKGYQKYLNTLFVAITNENELKCSYTHHILSEAAQCILIHAYDKLAYKNNYTYYDVEYIDADGAVSLNRVDANVRLYIRPYKHLYNQIMYLAKDDKVVYSCKGPWEDKMEIVWNLYLKIKDCSLKEAQLLGSLVQKDQQLALQEKTIKELEVTKKFLEQETVAYKSILDEIKALLAANNSSNQ